MDNWNVDTAERLKLINFMMGEIHDLSDDIYENFVDQDYSQVCLCVVKLNQRLKDLVDLLNYKSNFSRYDCFSEDFNMQIELKCRTRHYDELLIEHIKYEYMMQESAKNKARAIYINSTPQGVWAFDLNHISKTNALNWEVRNLPAKTHWDRGQTKSKKISYLHIDLGHNITDKLL